MERAPDEDDAWASATADRTAHAAAERLRAARR